jgi:glycosyltransferase involved in cell wall biosynthesis
LNAAHQLLPVLSPGDAIGTSVLRLRDMLRSMGFRSQVYAQLIDRRLAHQARPAERLTSELGESDALLYHLSIGSPLVRVVSQHRGPAVVVYHNITPAAYYRDTSPRVSYWLQRGRDDLALLAPRVRLVIADSTFNADEALAAGAHDTSVIPPPVDVERLDPQPARGVSMRPVILFVGRVAPNKGHADLVRALVVLRATSCPTARLVMLGNANDTGPYLAALRRFAARVGVADAITLPGEQVSDAALHNAFIGASVFASASEHEGFCAPLLEAMAFSLPVVAYAGGAVAETLDGAGLLTTTKDPFEWAALLERAITDRALRTSLIASGHKRLLDFQPAAVAARLQDALSRAGIIPSSRPLEDRNGAHGR